MMIFGVIAGLIVMVFLLTVFVGAPYVPSLRKTVDDAFDELCPISGADTVVDLGSGDGIVLRLASRRGARAVGYEVNPFLVIVSWVLSRRDSGVRVQLASFWSARFPDSTTVVYTFGETRDIVKMYQKVQQEAARIGKDIKFVSCGFMVPGKAITASSRSHHLYTISPLQDSQA